MQRMDDVTQTNDFCKQFGRKFAASHPKIPEKNMCTVRYIIFLE